MKINVSQFNKAIDILKSAQGKHYLKLAISGLVIGAGAKCAVDEIYAIGSTEGASKALEYVVNNKDVDELGIEEVKFTK